MSGEELITDSALEDAVLGGLVRQPRYLDVITPEMFFHRRHLATIVIPALRRRRERGEPSYRHVDGVRLEFPGLREALVECGSAHPDVDAARFAELVPDGWIRPSDPGRLLDLDRRRRIVFLAEELQREAWDDDRVHAITTELDRIGRAA